MPFLNRNRLTLSLLLAGLVIGLVLSAGVNLQFQVRAEEEPKADPAPQERLPQDDLAAITALSNAFANVIEKANPAVVTITTETVVSARESPFFFPFEDFFGGHSPRGERRQSGLGSGVIVRASGIILTNNHVVAQADDIVVRLIDGREFKAEVKGTDELSDLAVLHIDADNLPSLPFADSDRTRVGEWVLAIGSPLQPEFAHTVTSGIVSAKGRTGVGLSTLEDFIQTDAAINPGNSGGALVNLRGELVGINTAIASRSGGNIGIGFAISANLAEKVMTDILERGGVQRGYLGIQMSEMSGALAEVYQAPTSEGVLVTEVVSNSPASEAGILPEDIVLAIDARKVRNMSELRTYIGARGPGQTVTLTVLRNGKSREFRVTLAAFPEANPIAGNSAPQDNRPAGIEQLGMEVRPLDGNLRRRLDLDEDLSGVLVSAVQPGSVVAQAGLRRGDVIEKINRNGVGSVEDLRNALSRLSAGDAVVFFVRRDGRRIPVDFNLP
ncbi:MAG: Do family serine endopeptidase [Calditrichaeota bacterium]|nr:Do family serine endopeptidase [Calditrichota bacterium]HQU71642.1 Do family serine endopeptidase [Calditrichia bacterium]